MTVAVPKHSASRTPFRTTTLVIVETANIVVVVTIDPNGQGVMAIITNLIIIVIVIEAEIIMITVAAPVVMTT